jgi:nickel/cobalt exporter
MASAVIVAGVAIWMIHRTWREQQLEKAGHHHHHGSHDHQHGKHDHHRDHDEWREFDTGHGVAALEIFEKGVPARWRLHFRSGKGWPAKDVTLVTERPDESRQAFSFVDRGNYLESVEEIPEPHEFMARVSLGHAGHTHDYDVPFIEGGGHDHLHEEVHGLEVVQGGEYVDAHERAHADDIARRFRDRRVTTWQIVLFGLSGGLIPCPAAITVLLLCLQLKQLTLGVVLVVCFSIGLAITMVSAGVVAALSVRHVQKRWSGFTAFARRAPYASGVLMLLVALYLAVSGLQALPI